MFRKLLVALGWATGGVIGTCVVLYLILVAINWRDVEASPAALRMANLYRDRPAVLDEENGFIYLLGFDVAPGESPSEMGLKRMEWLQQYDGTAAMGAADPLGERPDYRAERDPVVLEYAKACSPGGKGCNAAIQAVTPKFDDWMRSEGWLLERYRKLVNHAAWRESVPTDVAAPLPSYALVMDQQKLTLLHARILATSRDAAGVREILGADLRFWRTVLMSSDTLISKMIATAAINRHFQLGAAAIKELPPQRVSGAIPGEWDTAISDAERSMRRCITGEWIFMSSVVRDTSARDMALAVVTEDSLTGKLFVSLSTPLYQPQDTINRYAEYYARVAKVLEGVALADSEAAANRATELSEMTSREYFWPRSPYNVLGQLLIGVGAGDYGSYARRVGDIEGVRRAALAAVHLHKAQVAPENIPAVLTDSSLRNPYNNDPFEWDATDETIIFRGLQAGERGEYRIY